MTENRTDDAAARSPDPAEPRPWYAVDTQQEEAGLSGLVRELRATLAMRPSGLGHVRLDFGFFANVIALDDTTGLAISTDGVGTKLLVAQMMGKYDTIGIDCVAMNVNDVLCVGAEPLTMVDYLAVQEPDPALLTAIGRGLRDGALQARVTIPGGEIAQVPEMIAGVHPGHGFDLAGTAVGTVPLDRIIVGEAIEPGDLVIGLASSGIHSNGLTLARQLFAKHAPASRIPDLARPLGEELLTPTRIYVREVLDVLRAGVAVKALIHVTSDGLLNLLRVKNRAAGFVIEHLPEPPAIFTVIQRELGVPPAEMFRVYNMGIGFCLVVSSRGDSADRALAIIRRHGVECYPIGRAVTDGDPRVEIRPARLVGRKGAGAKGGRFEPLP